MNPEEKAKTTSPVVTDAAAKEVIPAKPTGELSEQELTGVAGGVQTTSISNVKRPPSVAIKLPNPTDSSQSIFDRWGNL